VSRRLAPVDAAIVLAQAFVFLPVALRQAIDDDEGSYVLAAKLILSGKIPYRDFFLPQTPVLPYLVAGWAALAGESWIALRLLTAAIAIAIGALPDWDAALAASPYNLVASVGGTRVYALRRP
jgi:hypothetical protein